MPVYGTQFNTYPMIENYIYLFHLDQFILLPTCPQAITDTMQSSFSQTNAIARSAPIFTYSNSGPRSFQVDLDLHRDMMQMINYKKSNLNLDIDDDYTDTMINLLQSMSLPVYSAASKLVDPPMIALRFGNDIFIKGVISGGVSVTYKVPILDNGKYASVNVSFTVYETQPYDALSVSRDGSFRGLSTTLERSLFTTSEGSLSAANSIGGGGGSGIISQTYFQ